ncbi:MAG: fatty acid desaturase [Pseudomonadota bacterium]
MTPTDATDEHKDHKALLATLSADQRRALCAQSDDPALLRMTLHLGAVLAMGVWIATSQPFWGLLLLPQGVLLVFLFTALHELIHRTAFANDRLNDGFAALLGGIVLLPPRQFRYFHLAHHRFTHDPENDPELGSPKPTTVPGYVYLISGIPDWQWRVTTLISNAIYGTTKSYVPERGRIPVRTEARRYLTAYVALAFPSIAFGTTALIWAWLIPLLLGNPFLRAYLLAEHTHCPHVSDMFVNTRTTFTSRFVRWLAWNMPYHAEHHAYPAVPFHRLPEFHAICAPHLQSTGNGYGEFNANYVRTTLSGEPTPNR